MDVGFKKKTTVSQTLFEFGRKRNLKDNEMEDILQVCVCVCVCVYVFVCV